MTAVAGAIFTASEFNTHVRDNLLETAPAKATAASQFFVSTGINAVAARSFESDAIATAQTTSSVTYTNLTTLGPQVSLQAGTRALVFISCEISNSTGGAVSRASVEVNSQGDVQGADDSISIAQGGVTANSPTRAGISLMVTGLNSGLNVFTMKYRVDSGTATFSNRELVVIPL